MDHLPFPHTQDSMLARMKMPLYPANIFTYDGKGVLGYRGRIADSSESEMLLNGLLRLKYRHLHPSDSVEQPGELNDAFLSPTDDAICVAILTLIQQWLYLGLLLDVFDRSGLDVQVADFVRRLEDGRCVLDTTQITRYIYHWHVLEDENDDWTSSRNMRFCALTISATLDQLNTFERHYRFFEIMDKGAKIENKACGSKAPSDSWGDDPFSHCYPRAGIVRLSIRVLVETLSSCLGSVFGSVNKDGIVPRYDRIGFSIPAPLEIRNQRSADQLIIDMLALVGYCPHERSILQDRVEPTTLLSYLDGLQRTASMPRREHRCPIAQMDHDRYLQAHRSICKNEYGPLCSTIAPLATGSRLSEAINNGITLAVKCIDGIVQYVDATKEPYVGISHVWADGLGNPRGNTMPICQIEHLQHASNVAAGYSELGDHNIAFWIDTLCVPVHDKHAKKIAISRMAEVYRDCKLVLVIDAALTAQRIPSTSAATYRALSGSVWNQRLWTYQEGYLAPQLQFAFANGNYVARMSEWKKSNAGQYERHSDTSYWSWLRDPVEGRLRFDCNHEALQFGGKGFSSARNHCAKKLVLCAGGLERLEDSDDRWSAYTIAQDDNDRPIARTRNQALQLAKESEPNVPAEQARRLLLRLGRNSHGAPHNYDAHRIYYQYSTFYSIGRLGRHAPFALFMRAMSWRSTSRPEDEMVCLALMLELDVDTVLKVPERDRLWHILLQVRKLPKNFFLYTGPRDERVSRRWVPKTFLMPRTEHPTANHFMKGNDAVVSPSEDNWVEATREGLIIQAEGFTVAPSWTKVTHHHSDKLFLTVDTGHTWVVNFITGPRLTPTKLNVQALSGQRIGFILYEGEHVIPQGIPGALCQIDPDTGDFPLKAHFVSLSILRKPQKETSWIDAWHPPTSKEADSWSAKDFECCADAIFRNENQNWLLC